MTLATAPSGPPAIGRTPWEQAKRILLPIIPFLILAGVWTLWINIADTPRGVMPEVLSVLEGPVQRG